MAYQQGEPDPAQNMFLDPADTDLSGTTLPRHKPLFGSLRGSLLAAFVLLSVLSIGLAASVGMFLSIRTSRNLIFDELASEVEINEQGIVNWLNERKHDLAVIVNNPGDAGNARQVLTGAENFAAYEAFQKRLLVETGPTSRFKEMFLLDGQGQVVLSTDADNIGKIHQNQSYFQQGWLAPYISSPFYNISAGQTEIVITVPVRDEFGGVMGILAGRVNLSELTDVILSRTGATQTGETYLVSQNHRFLTRPRFQPKSEAARSKGINQALTPGPNRNGQDVYENYNGVRVVGAYRWIPELNVVLLAERAEVEALAGVRQLGWFSGGVAVLAMVVAVVVALYITSRITRPITQLTGVAVRIAEGDLSQSVTVESGNEIGVLAQAFNIMTGRLRNLINTLEDRIQQRTQALETSIDISSRLIAILDLNELLQYIVTRIQTEFGFYHTHIYLVEEETGDLVMVEGSGNVGRQLKEKGHRLPAGQGIVGTVASTNQHFLSNNVDEVLNFVRNPLLLNTHSELAVPLRKGEQVLGVLDIQSEDLNRFSQADVSLMQSIANQAAIAIDNARLVAEMRDTLQEVERLNRRLTRQAWEETGQEIPVNGYRFVGGGRAVVSPASDAWLPPMSQAAIKRQLVKQTYPGNGGPPRAELAVPLVLRGEIIGVLGVKRETIPDWRDDEVEAVESIANQIALALENARLSKEQEKTIVQLKEVDRLKSEFLTSMSHELRTPLNSIIGFADVLLQGIDGELNDLALNDIRLIYNSGQHLLALINDILDLSKIEAGKMELLREPVDVHQAIQHVLEASTSLLKDKPVKVVVEAGESLPAVNADRLRLNQILLNLLSNAAKFTEEGTITLRAEVPAGTPDMMRISVIDTGIGIPPDKLAAVFDRFRQADSSTTRKYGGTGLGLAIAKQLVEMHGGEISATSREGEGTTFSFTIPLYRS